LRTDNRIHREEIFERSIKGEEQDEPRRDSKPSAEYVSA
jgi:hypothetical protein